VDAAATEAQRSGLAATRAPLTLFDRGPGYRMLSGQAQADVD